VPRDAVYMSGWGKQACFVVPSLDLVVVRVGSDRKLNEHPEFYSELWKRLMAAVLDRPQKFAPPSARPVRYAPVGRASAGASPGSHGARPAAAGSRPFDGGSFKGRIAYSCDGNHNDPDDWIASPVTLVILAESGLKDRLVHFDYNCILPQTNPEWEKIHAESVLGAAERYGFHKSVFFDDRKNLEASVASIAQAINDSTKDNPLYFLIAGPMEVPYWGIQKSDPARRQFVYCISHSRWNDGFASNYKFTFTKRGVIEQDVHWVQIGDQNRRLSFGRYGRPSLPEEFKPYFWMRDSRDAKVRWLWERMVISTRPDPSDAGMTWFLVSGDQDCDPAKLKRLIEDHQLPAPAVARHQVRLEAENFRHLEGFALEDRNDGKASHRLNVKCAGRVTGRIRTRFDEPFTSDAARYDVAISHLVEPGGQARLRFLVNGLPASPERQASNPDGQWAAHTIPGLLIQRGDELTVEVLAGGAGTVRLDYVQLNVAVGTR
jgi:hypothetical protein